MGGNPLLETPDDDTGAFPSMVPSSTEPCAYGEKAEERSYEAGMKVTAAVELVAKLGEGAMGEVWKANHVEIEGPVAVKLISRKAWQQPNVRRRFQREAMIAGQLEHPHVVKLYDQGRTEDDLPFMVMELLTGRSIEEVLEERARLTPHQTFRLVSQIASALTLAHGIDVIHRDIKPENIFLVEGDDGAFMVKLVDFGIAKQTRDEITQLTAAGMLLGTPYYMNPEQLLGESGVDRHSDLWALAAVAYACLTGAIPFPAETLTELLVAMRDCEVVPPTRVDPELPEAVDGFFVRALARDRDRRFQSADELAAAFEEALGDLAEVPPDDEEPLLETTAASIKAHDPAMASTVETDMAAVLEHDSDPPDSAPSQDLAPPRGPPGTSMLTVQNGAALIVGALLMVAVAWATGYL